MTSTSFNVGLGSGSRNSSKVLKPPGGGSSDIFGSAGHEQPEPQQRKVRNHLTSSIFTGETTETPSRNKAGNDSFYNLFGAEPQSQTRPVSAFKDKFTSNIVLDSTATNAKKSLMFSEDNCKVDTDKISSSELGQVNENETDSVYKSNGSEGDIQHQENNQVATNLTNGEKTETTVNGSSSASSTASTPASAPSTAPSAAPQRARVPPGGFSSGLW